MMWFFAAILVAVPSVTSACGGTLTLTASNTQAIFKTPNYPGFHSPSQTCEWKVSAPGNVEQIKVVCQINIRRASGCSYSSFSYYKSITTIRVCGTGTLSRTLPGSTNKFTFQSAQSSNSKFKGLSCTVSYNPADIPTGTTPVNPSCTCGQKGGQRIVGGNEATPNEYPWQAQLIYKSSRSHFCGGSVIAKRWVLSASHCVEDKNPSSILVVLGEHDYGSSDSLSQDFEVTQIIKHENYGVGNKLDNDIALLKLVTPVSFNQVISPICLPFNYKYYDFSDKTGSTSGWGLTSPGNYGSRSRVLKEIDLEIIMPSKCTNFDGYVWIASQVSENMICGVAQNGGTCQGDSGGPMVWKSPSNLYFQLGITSFGGTCANPTHPSVYARVSKFVDWIVAKTGAGDELCVKI